jgi:PTS system nitrogen regulatory IIA component
MANVRAGAASYESQLMHLSDFLDFDAITTRLSGGNKRSLLQQLANIAANRLDLESGPILASVTEREQLGSTGFGQGVAIPHGKIEGLARIYGLFARLSEPIDY